MRANRFPRLSAWLLLPAVAVLHFAQPAGAEEALPIFDTHVHYSEPAWKPFPPAAVSGLLDTAGVPRALVSSTPDDGSLTLAARDGTRFVPVLRPYREGVGLSAWATDAATPPYLAGRLERRTYAGIGEFHLLDTDAARTAVVAQVAGMAVARGIVLHVHAGAAPVAELFRVEPRVRVLWAHAGMTTPPEEIRRMLEAHEALWAELSFRAYEIMPDDTLDPEWEALLLDHNDRFVIGSDTYVTGRWEEYESLIAQHRAWLAKLPPDKARAIAYRNAVRLFGSGGLPALER